MPAMSLGGSARVLMRTLRHDAGKSRDYLIWITWRWRFLHNFYAAPVNLYGVFICRSLYFGCTNYVPGDDAMDLLYIALMIGFVAVSVGLTYYLERLRRPQ